MGIKVVSVLGEGVGKVGRVFWGICFWKYFRKANWKYISEANTLGRRDEEEAEGHGPCTHTTSCNASYHRISDFIMRDFFLRPGLESPKDFRLQKSRKFGVY